MFERIKRGWQIVEDSWTVLKRYPKLLVFPVVSGIAALIVAAAIALPLSQSDYVLQRRNDLLHTAVFR